MPASRFRLAANLMVLYLVLFIAVFGDLTSILRVLTVALASLLIWASIIDFESRRLPDSSSFGIAVFGSLAIVSISPSLILPHLITAGFGFAFLWFIGEAIFRIRDVDGLGIGDAKLFGVGLIWIGPLGAPGALMIASLGGILYAAVSIFLRKSTRQQSVPFGPFLAFGIYSTWILGPITF